MAEKKFLREHAILSKNIILTYQIKTKSEGVSINAIISST